MPGRIHTAEDTGLNDSDKVIALSTELLNRVLSVHVQLTATATAGNRRAQVMARDSGGNILWASQPTAVQAANLAYEYTFAVGLAVDDSAALNTFVRVPLPYSWLPSSADLRIRDIGAVDAAADDMTVRVVYETAPQGG